MAEETKPNANPNEGGNTNTDKGDGTDGKGDASGAAGASGGTDAKWYETSIPKELHEHVQGYESQAAMVKDLADLKVTRAVPEKADGYVVKFAEDVKIPEEAVKSATGMYSEWRNAAKDVGLTQDQYTKLISAHAKMVLAQESKSKEDFKKVEDGLKADWGKDYDSKLAASEKVVNGIFSADDVSFFKKSGLVNDPRFIKAMFGLSLKLSEDSFVRNERKGEGTASKVDPMTGKPMLSYPSMDKK